MEIDMRLLAVALSLALGFAVGGVSGKWQGSFRVNGGDHDVQQLLFLNRDGAKLTGTGGPDATERYPISNGQVNGDHVTFEITTGDWKFFYDLRSAGQQMSGKLTLKSANDTRSAEVSLQKAQ
jgi:hypothetical protein